MRLPLPQPGTPHLQTWVVAWLLVLAGIAAVAPPTCPAATSPAPNAADHAACDHLLATYLESVRSLDLAAATDCWRPADLAAAERMGITYPDAPFKLDSDSPAWLRRADLAAGRLAFSRAPVRPVSGDHLQQTVTFAAGGDTARFTYHFARENGSWRLASPLALAQAGAPGHAGRWVTLFDLRQGREPGLAAATVANLDSCVVAMTRRLAWDDDDLARLAAGSLGYVVADAGDVASLAGAPTVGVANLQLDAVVTTHPCHAHELAHLVTSAWLRRLPLHMLPLLQEGVAVQLGGRSGRHPRVLDRVGRTTLAAGWVTPDELLTGDGFRALPADLSYAPAGAFAGFLLQRYGPEGLRAACLAAGGSSDELAGLTAATVRERLARAVGEQPDSLLAAFARHCAAPASSGIDPGAATHGTKVDAPAVLRGTRLQVHIVSDATGSGADSNGSPSAIGIEVRGNGSGALLFGGGAAAGANALFGEHFPGRPWRGETHGLLFTDEEVKLYDYRLEMLVALHAEGFWPSTTYREDDGTLRFRVARDLWPQGAPTLVEAAR